VESLVTSAKGHQFVSETDTEIIAHLIEDEHNVAAAANGSANRVPHSPP
jgi:glucosamine 6-phosphate synthetase-like amidotransferase/phosphosugar isomerase protein